LITLYRIYLQKAKRDRVPLPRFRTPTPVASEALPWYFTIQSVQTFSFDVLCFVECKGRIGKSWAVRDCLSGAVVFGESNSVNRVIENYMFCYFFPKLMFASNQNWLERCIQIQAVCNRF